jgi:hypothetical protein
MTNRMESVMDALVTNLDGLATTASRVHRAFAVVPDLPALIVTQGADSVSTMEYGEVKRALNITVDARIKKSATADTELNAIAAEVYAALMTDPTQGLAYVERTEPVSSDGPTQKNLEESIVSQSLTFRVHYQHATKTLEG